MTIWLSRGRIAPEPNDYDVVVSDNSMLGIMGINLAAEIRNIRDDIPIIICTGYAQLLESGSIKDSGIVDIIRKPVRRLDLARSVREALDDKIDIQI